MPSRSKPRLLGCRYVNFEAIYSTMYDTLVVCDDEKDPRAPATSEAIHPGCLKSGMVVCDLTAVVQKSKLLREAELRKCIVVQPREVLLDRLSLQARLFTGLEVPREVLAAPLRAFEEDFA